MIRETATIDMRPPKNKQRLAVAKHHAEEPIPASVMGKVSLTQAKPYIVIHLEASNLTKPVGGEVIVRFINKFMGDTHSILFTGQHRTQYIEQIVSAVVHSEFHDIVGQLSTETLRHVINGADAVATANTELFWLADRLATPVLLLDPSSASPLKPWSQHGYQLGLSEEQSTPYQICEALAYLLSFPNNRPAPND